jgi:hypothetical protein
VNALDPPKRSAPGREIAGAAKLRLLRAYRFLLIAQPRRAVRQCVACGTGDQPLARRLVRAQRTDRPGLVSGLRGLSKTAPAQSWDYRMKPAIFISMVGSALEKATRNVQADKIIRAIKEGKWRAPLE